MPSNLPNKTSRALLALFTLLVTACLVLSAAAIMLTFYLSLSSH
jgi:hypothetical protein